MNLGIKKVFVWLMDVTQARFSVYATLLNIVCSLFSIPAIGGGVMNVLFIVAVSCFVAYLESVVYRLLGIKALRMAFAVIIAAVMNLLAVVDCFLWVNFKRTICYDTIALLLETNGKEASNFMETYLSASSVCAYVLVALLINVAFVFISNFLKRKSVRAISAVAAVAGAVAIGSCVHSYVVNMASTGITQISSLSRVGYAMYLVHKNKEDLKLLAETCRNAKAEQRDGKKLNVVVVIGESFSVYRSSLYGCERNTNPRLKKRVDSGDLFLFDDAVTIYHATSIAMQAVFSLGERFGGFFETPLFPACFKAVGYSNCLYDNEYFDGDNENSFLCYKELSDILYDKRNSKAYQYDMDMVNDAPRMKEPYLSIYHLCGQHYTYKERYPASFTKFKPSDYDKKYSARERDMMANYDNANLYNDYVVDSIFKKHKDDYCVVVYFSDHGEEVFELRDFMGHGSSHTSPNPNYQLRVPLMVWMSPSYRAENPDMAERLKRAEKYPISTDDISHALLDMAGITCKDFNPRRSFINDDYDTLRHRIVMRSVDYDKDIKPKR